MKPGLLLAAALLVLVAAGHSMLGERYILLRLFRRENLPRLFGSDVFTRQTLRFAWHITSIAWLGFAAVLVVLARPGVPPRSSLLLAISATFGASALLAAIASRLKHLAWIAFAAVALLSWLAL